MGLTVNSVYSLFALCSDLVYVVLFPQLCCVIYVQHTNTYGSMTGYLLGFILRVLGGEKLIGLPPAIKYPYYSDVYGQMFPFRTLAMVCSFTTILVVSYLVRYLFKKEILPLSMDFLYCFREYDLKHHEEPKIGSAETKDENVPKDKLEMPEMAFSNLAGSFEKLPKE